MSFDTECGRILSRAPVSPEFRARALLRLSLLILAAGCTATEAPPVTVEQHPWTSPVGTAGTQLLTDHYDLRVTAQDAELRAYLPGFMETAFAEYRRLMPPARGSEERLITYVFGTRNEWVSFTKLFRPSQAYTYLHIHAGGYMDHATATSVFWDIGRDRTLSLMAHEGLHQYLARFFPEPVPAWLNEGLATQFEAFDLKGDRPVFTPRRNYMRTNYLREALVVEGGLAPLPRLLSMNAAEAVTKTGQPARGYYAQVWSLVLCLHQHPAYAAGFKDLLADIGTERLRQNVDAYRAGGPERAALSDGEAAFRRYITDNLQTFEDDYMDFAKGLVH